jgi:hypothetical protein
MVWWPSNRIIAAYSVLPGEEPIVLKRPANSTTSASTALWPLQDYLK